MKKTVFAFVLGLMCFQAAMAQKMDMPKQDTLLYYMTNSGNMVGKAIANYVLVIMPPDSSSGKKLFPVKEYYLDGKAKLLGYSSTNEYKNLNFEGSCIVFFPNGHKKSISNYANGFLSGYVNLYYPNGKFYATEIYSSIDEPQLIACDDSLGNVLAENGNGKWVRFDDDISEEIEEGAIKDSVEEGEWKGKLNGNVEFSTIYKNGKVISSTDQHHPGRSQIFITVSERPEFKGGPIAFNNYLARTVVYPVPDRDGRVQGRVLATFVIEKDGTLSSIKIIRSPTDSMAAEIMRVIKASPPWIPGMQKAVPVRVQFTTSFEFSLANN